jgi:hypothetical protein
VFDAHHHDYRGALRIANAKLGGRIAPEANSLRRQ